MIEDHDGNLIVGSANGAVYRYDTNSWAVETLSLSHGSSIVHLEEIGNSTYIAGTQNGKVTMIDGATFTEEDTYTSQGPVVGTKTEYTGQVYITTSFLSYSKIRLYDLDTDGDGVTDTNDAFPTEITQWNDEDMDGYGDNPNGFNGDQFPDDETQYIDADGDGHGDNPAGTEGDLFPNNPDQWQDRDGDGYGDNMQGEGGDMFPDEPTQWEDGDQDGYGSNPNGLMPDACPTQNGFSKYDRYGCTDSDLDGYSNPDESFGVNQGADACQHKAPNGLTKTVMDLEILRPACSPMLARGNLVIPPGLGFQMPQRHLVSLKLPPMVAKILTGTDGSIERNPLVWKPIPMSTSITTRTA